MGYSMLVRHLYYLTDFTEIKCRNELFISQWVNFMRGYNLK